MSRPIYTQGWTDERKLLMKLVEVYKQVQYIQKRGKNKFHNYNYATEADVNEKVREEIANRNVIMIPEIINKELRTTTTKSGNTEYIYRVDMEFNFMDAETGENLLVQMSGEGQDVGDKAIFKAISGCQKYALMKAFMIPTGDDPEGDDEADKRNSGEYAQQPQQTRQQAPQTPPQTSQGNSSGQRTSVSEPATDPQVKMLRAKMSAAKMELNHVNAYLGIQLESITELPRSRVNDLIKYLDANKVSQ